jgi:hypothetical protein
MPVRAKFHFIRAVQMFQIIFHDILTGCKSGRAARLQVHSEWFVAAVVPRWFLKAGKLA